MLPVPDLWTVHLGVVPYSEALDLQHRVRAARQADAVPDVLLLLEHPPTYTRGRRSEPGELTRGEAWYAAQGIEIADVDRGGKVTYHGPGQLTGYPIMRVDAALAFVRTMEQALVSALAFEGVDARNRPADGLDYTGVWVQDRKIASVGVHISRGVSTHGFAVNVDNDLAPFEWVIACGLPSVSMTSIARETGRTGRLPCFRKEVAFRFAEAHGLRQRLVSRARLERALAGAPVAA
jgi:lipoyl(octanoyl) transferase